MDDFGNALSSHDRDGLFGYVWWMYGLELFTAFGEDINNDCP